MQIRTTKAASISIVVISLNIVLVLLVEYVIFQEDLAFTKSQKRLMERERIGDTHCEFIEFPGKITLRYDFFCGKMVEGKNVCHSQK
ncbi:hypothetical protein HR13_02900 [Porphyromonas gulae]|nr:hypothetical protein HR13_02900 [Porphyromonas gulae]